MAKVWQVASGDAQHNYSQLFIKHDVMFIGPGRFGSYEPRAYQRVVEDGEFKKAKIATIRQFHDQVEPNDVVLLRFGRKVLRIGLVASEYEYDERFDDVNGWDLQHCRRIVWQDRLTPSLEKLQRGRSLFGFMRLLPTFSVVTANFGDVLERIAPLRDQLEMRALREKPPMPPDPLTLEELGQALFSRGVANEAVDRVLVAIERQRRLLRWYAKHGKDSDRPHEHEVVAHMILPLLLALGWSEQLLAIEWHRIDLAAFCKTPTTPQACVLVCEAKGMRHGLRGVIDQAVRYAKSLKLKNCKRILLTQGSRFYLYDRPPKGWSSRALPSGYVNVEKIRTEHVYPPSTNAADTIVALGPVGVVHALD